MIDYVNALILTIVVFLALTPVGRYICTQTPVECPLCCHKTRRFRVCESCLKPTCWPCFFSNLKLPCTACRVSQPV